MATGEIRTLKPFTLLPKTRSQSQPSLSEHRVMINTTITKSNNKKNMCTSESNTFETFSRKTRRVVFDRRVKMRFALHINDYSTVEKEATWFTRAEMEAVREEANSIIERNSSRVTDDGMDPTIWGLEARLPDMKRITRARRQHAKESIFREQELQFAAQECIPELIADAYRPISLICQKAAHARALTEERTQLLLQCLEKQQATPPTKKTCTRSVQKLEFSELLVESQIRMTGRAA